MSAIVLSPTSGDIDGIITITGTSFLATTNITITWDGFTIVTTPPTVTTDGSGGFNCTILPPNSTYGTFTISATDGTNTSTESYTLERKPEYCQVKDVEDWLRWQFDSNTDPNVTMVENLIMDNEDDMDRLMGHTFMEGKQVTEIFDVTYLWDWSRGLPMYPRHRNLKPFDATKGDKFEAWNGIDFEAFGSEIEFETIKGTIYVRGFLFTTITKSRFRVTYRYGGDNEGQSIPRDIKRCAVLMTSWDLLSTDFTMSQLAYGGEGNVDKGKIMDKWEKKTKEIIHNHSEIITIW